MEKVSIIVPMFNSIHTINKCVESIMNQTYKNIELLVIDDGSKDGSYEFCLSLEKKYKNMFVFKNDGKGVSSARNYGINKASGDYIEFVDSDDYIDLDTVSKAVDKINNSDIVIWGYIFESNISQKEHLIKKNFDSKNVLEFINNDLIDLLSNYSINNIGTKLYRNSIIKSNDIRFGNDNICEDIGFAFEYLKYCLSISYIDECLYHYVNNDEGLMHQNKPNFINAKKALLSSVESFIKNSSIDMAKFVAYVYKNIRALFIDSYLYSNNVNQDFKQILNDDYYRMYIVKYKKQTNRIIDKLFCFMFLHKKIFMMKQCLKLYLKKRN